ncbi:hypothetical protein NQZ79_g965 [Umbelopsis isabellina]|nr:hypothetical protein NQZ79_g965 [Umbelopsis isabellina]
MSKRFQNTNKFRNVVGKVAKRDNWFSELQISTSSLSDNANLIQANRKWLAVKWNGSGGTLALLPVDKPGKLASGENISLLHAHGAGLTDWSFSEFDQQVVATGAEDGTTEDRRLLQVKVWRVPEDGISGDSQATCSSTMSIQAPRTNSVKFHPTADNIITTLGSNRKEIMIWDLGKEKEALKVEAEAPLHSFAWKGDGSLIATTGKDIVQVWDPRQSKEAIQTGKGHEGIKGSRSMWLGSGNFLMTTGLNKMRYRQYGIWDARNLEKPIKMSSFDSSTGQLIPLYDEDTETMYFVGRGDSTIRSFQLSNLDTEPTISENMACGTNNPLFGACLLPKLSLNVMSAEIARIMTVTNNAVVPVSFEVPRKVSNQYLDFHVELFPDTKGSEPALPAERWLAGENAIVNTVSMDPSKRQNALVNKKVETPSKLPTQEKPKPSEVTKEAGLTDKTVSSTESSSNDEVSVKEEKPSSEITDSSDQQVSEGIAATEESPKASSNNSTTSNVKPVAKKLPKYGGTNVSSYKYILGKPYHPSKHYVDLRGLSNDKSGATELIQANSKFIAVPISGPGGRVGIIVTAKPGRLPTKIPCVLCGSSVVDFKFDPFDPNVLVTASEDDKLRIWQIPDEGITEDVSEASHVLSSNSMDKIVTIAFNPVAKDVLLTVSADRNNCGIRLWDLATKEEKRHLAHGDTVFDVAWKSDGKQFATISKSKKVKVFDANNFDLIAEGPGHNSIRPAKLTWLGETNMIASIGFGLGSSREVLVYKVDDLTKGPSFKKTIDESPSAMSAHYDPDCGILYVAGKGDRIIHTFEVEENSLTPLAKYESENQQQGIAFLPKRYCDVKEIEIGKFYRLTANSIVTTSMKVRRARPEYFEDSIFCPTLNVETAAQDSKSWFNGESKEMHYISLQPDDMTPLSKAPPLPQTAAKKKFAIGKKEASDDEKRKELMQKMFASAKDVEDKAELTKAAPVKDEEKEVADDEWVSIFANVPHNLSLISCLSIFVA